LNKIHNIRPVDGWEINRDIGNEVEEKNDGGENRHNEIKGHSIGTIQYFVFFDIMEEDFDEFIKRKVFVIFELNLLEPIPARTCFGIL
jgi:hypothetical protein